MKLRLLIGIWIVSTTLNSANATQCSNEQPLLVVNFPKNSSYFDHGQRLLLDKTVQKIKSLDKGYLLLNYQFKQQSKSEKMQQYNLWIAQNRIERVKHYYTEQDLDTPIIIKKQTSSPTHKRQVNISWCQQ